jgi:hypothetical protein
MMVDKLESEDVETEGTSANASGRNSAVHKIGSVVVIYTIGSSGKR